MYLSILIRVKTLLSNALIIVAHGGRKDSSNIEVKTCVIKNVTLF